MTNKRDMELQTRLDFADAWARTVWHQLQPIFIMRTEVRLAPHYMEHEILVAPSLLTHTTSTSHSNWNYHFYAWREARLWAWDAAFGYLPPVKLKKESESGAT